jgi:2-dehydro-3-deoxyphosphooctonate aldolase (KDO 8-P synthase)
MNIVSVGSIEFGKDRMPLIGGPCAIEGLDHSLRMANSINEIAEKIGFPLVFKSSFDKANRTSIHSYRGLGFDEGLEILSKVKSEIGVPVLTDIHEAHQAEPASQAFRRSTG